MKIRLHRELLSDSMKTVMEIEPTQAAIDAFARERMSQCGFHSPGPIQAQVTRYTYDSRIDWDTHIVCVPGYGTVAFTDGPLANLDGIGAGK